MLENIYPILVRQFNMDRMQDAGSNPATSTKLNNSLWSNMDERYIRRRKLRKFQIILATLIFVFTMAIGVPIIFSAGIATVAGLLIADIPLSLMALSAWTAFEPFPLVTIPLFILAGQLMEHGGMSDKLVVIAKKLVGAYKGGLGLVTVVACMFFAALSGSGPATTAAIGSITIPAMQKEGYDSRFAGGIAAAAGALGSMIPPSNLLFKAFEPVWSFKLL